MNENIYIILVTTTVDYFLAIERESWNRFLSVA